MDIVITIDNNYIEYCATMLVSLIEKNPDTNIRCFVIHEEIKERLLYKFNKTFENCSSITFIFELVEPSILQAAPISHHISIATYFRLLIPDILPLYVEKVLFLDSDILIQSSLQELWDTDIKEHYLAATIAAGMDDYPQEIGLDKNSLYFNAGVMLLNLKKIRNFKLFSKSLHLIQNESHRIKWWDQDILNILFLDSWLPIKLKWNVQPFIFNKELKNSDNQNLIERYDKFGYEEAIKFPIVIHFAGGNKPWLIGYNGFSEKVYKHYQSKTAWKPNFIKKIYGQMIWMITIVKAKI
ncbi:lipopolysaccharide biosynthesis glycosyltransferase [Pedobacter psychrotolerans]|uniref:LPS 1,2-glucosyltransferase n=1 Tax=Pedobacter psychrotolerans TaxID=1843235 RepID=A0A4R2HLA5_9SPHI|nr:glycosyltransferase family 8 protein [Pedobacter psychrotolerans]TCO30798.1 lipopolysaccharide biosynthesis glycosyltransferase [Pedobacter psychrotolerans]GGE44361.1 LPS 1,2-glucosyltransferase [Pedobacter psychrotolerans]